MHLYSCQDEFWTQFQLNYFTMHSLAIRKTAGWLSYCVFLSLHKRWPHVGVSSTFVCRFKPNISKIHAQCDRVCGDFSDATAGFKGIHRERHSLVISHRSLYKWLGALLLVMWRGLLQESADELCYQQTAVYIPSVYTGDMCLTCVSVHITFRLKWIKWLKELKIDYRPGVKVSTTWSTASNLCR